MRVLISPVICRRSMRKHTNKIVYPKEDEKSEIIKKLRGTNKHLQKENKRLKSELKTLEAAFIETQGFVKKQMWDFSVEEVIDAVKKNRRAKAAGEPETLCNNCNTEMDHVKVPSLGGTVYVCTGCNNRFMRR